MEYVGLTGIIPFTYFGGVQKAVGSTTLRVDRLCENDVGFEKWQHGKKYDNLIFQKAYWNEMMQLFEGPKILDLCDPDWVRDQLDIIDIGNKVHAITCSSKELTKLMKNYFPEKIVCYVPDRMNFKIFPIPKDRHTGKAKSVVWFGFIHNAYETLEPFYQVIKDYNLELHIIADKPYEQEDKIIELNPRFTLYDPENAYELIKESDIVLNPKSSKAFFKYKSNNKSLIAWTLGLPVATTSDELIRLINPEDRNEQVEKKQKMVYQDYDIIQSAKQYKDIIKQIREAYFS